MPPFPTLPCNLSKPSTCPTWCTTFRQETVKDGNIFRGWDGYLGKQASSGAIRRINRFREADRMFSASSVTSGQASSFTAAAATKVRMDCHYSHRARASSNLSLSPFLPPNTLTSHGPRLQGAPGASASGGAKVKKAPAGSSHRKRAREDE